QFVADQLVQVFGLSLNDAHREPDDLNATFPEEFFRIANLLLVHRGKADLHVITWLRGSVSPSSVTATGMTQRGGRGSASRLAEPGYSVVGCMGHTRWPAWRMRSAGIRN